MSLSKDARTAAEPGNTTGAMTVGELLELEVIQRAGPTYLGTSSGLDRPVQWVHPTEIADIAQFLSGGEAVLTSGLGFGKDARHQREYVRSLAKAKVAVLVVELAGRTFGRLPEAVRDEAAKVDLPIICAATEFPFAAVTSQVHRRIVSSQIASLEAVERASREFGELLASDADPLHIVQHLAQIGRCPVVLETVGGEIRGYSGGSELTDDLVMHWRRHWVAEHATDQEVDNSGQDTSSPGALAGRPHPCAMVPVLLRGRPWGYLHALATSQSPDITRYVVERAATFIAIALLNQRVDRARRTARQSALLSRLMNGSVSANVFAREALAMGVDLRNGPYLVLAVAGTHQSDSNSQGYDGDGSASASELAAARLVRRGLNVLVQEDARGDLVVAALPGPEAVEIVREEARGAGTTCGLSGTVSSITDLPEATIEARQAMNVAAVMSPGQLREREDLGLFGLLVDMADGPGLRRFVDRELRPLMGTAEHPLLNTLAVYVRSGFNKAAAAKLLHIQRRTLYYRLEKVATHLNADLDSPDVQTRLAVAVAGAQLLNLV